MTDYAYRRISPREKEDPRLGLEAQTEYIEHFSPNIEEWFTDIDVSRDCELEDREALPKAIARLRRGDRLIIARWDRLTSDHRISAAIMIECVRRGAQLVSADGTGNGAGPFDDFVRDILISVSKLQLAITRMNTKAALAIKKRKGQLVGSVPFGKRIEGAEWAEVPTKDGGTRRKLVAGVLVDDDGECEARSHAIRRMEAGDGLRAIARSLEVAGHMPRKAAHWHPQAVARLLGDKWMPKMNEDHRAALSAARKRKASGTDD